MPPALAVSTPWRLPRESWPGLLVGFTHCSVNSSFPLVTVEQAVCLIAFRKCCSLQHGEWFSSVAFRALSCADFFFHNPSLWWWNMHIVTKSGSTWCCPFHPLSYRCHNSTLFWQNEISSWILSISVIHSFVDAPVGCSFRNVAVPSSVLINMGVQTSQMTRLYFCVCVGSWLLLFI